MDSDALKRFIGEILPSTTFDETGEWLNVQIAPAEWLGLATELKKREALYFDFLFCVTCIDWKTHLTMVYHLRSTKYQHCLVIKANLEKTDPDIESVSHLWRTAEFHEREAYEMFGVKFLHHPDLRLLILPDDWEGRNPMRKDFEDPVNMIKL